MWIRAMKRRDATRLSIFPLFPKLFASYFYNKYHNVAVKGASI
jgi:hypothetical protein